MYDTPETPATPALVTIQPKKKRRVFFWVFLAIQLIFVIWLIGGIASAGGTPTDCGSLDAQTCNDAQSVGTGIGVFLIVILWMAVDFIVGITYAIYRMARR